MWAEDKTPAYRYGEIPGAATVSENLSCCTRTMRQRGRVSIPQQRKTLFASLGSRQCQNIYLIYIPSFVDTYPFGWNGRVQPH